LSKERFLSEKEFRVLESICQRFTARLKNRVCILRNLSLVKFSCRSLEKIQLRHDIGPLHEPFVLELQISPENEEFVNGVIKETTDSDYFSKVSLPGYHADHYRGSHAESTLVAFMHGCLSSEVSDLQVNIEAELPGAYEWVHENARHITLLGLNDIPIWDSDSSKI
jgi:hypothetical protein